MKKGFTLLELLVIIVMIGLISLLIIPTVNRIIKNNEDKAYKILIKSIESAANDFINEYLDVLPESDEYTIELKILKDMSYVEEKLKDPNAGEYFADESLITFKKENKLYYALLEPKFSTEISENIKYDNYLLILKGNNICENNCEEKSNLIVLNTNGSPLNTKDEEIVVTTNSSNKEIVYKYTPQGQEKNYSLKRYLK